LQGRDLYPHDPSNSSIRRCPAILLAIPAYFGKIALYTFLSFFNVVAWWMTAQFSNAMTGRGGHPAVAVRAAGFVTVTFVFDMFDLGQPNLVLLAVMLFGFWLLQHERPWMAGSMFALATAIKVFPVAVFPICFGEGSGRRSRAWWCSWAFSCSWFRPGARLPA